MPTYIKKQLEVEAFQYDEAKQEELEAFAGQKFQKQTCTSHLWIPTLEGLMTLKHGDWLIKGIEGELYPCKPSIFEKTYELKPKTRRCKRCHKVTSFRDGTTCPYCDHVQ